MTASGGSMPRREPDPDNIPVQLSPGMYTLDGRTVMIGDIEDAVAGYREMSTAEPAHPQDQVCRVYWGSHGCDRPRHHEGDCVCLDCLYDENGDPDWDGYVGMPPYYGPDTRFYGDDVEARGLPMVTP